MDAWKTAVILQFEFEQCAHGLLMHLKDAGSMSNCVDFAVWSGSTLFAQNCLSDYLRSFNVYDDEVIGQQVSYMYHI